MPSWLDGGVVVDLLLDQGLLIIGLESDRRGENLCHEFDSTKHFNGPPLIECGFTFFAPDAPDFELLLFEAV